jgi:hypothetical protein
MQILVARGAQGGMAQQFSRMDTQGRGQCIAVDHATTLAPTLPSPGCAEGGNGQPLPPSQMGKAGMAAATV